MKLFLRYPGSFALLVALSGVAAHKVHADGAVVTVTKPPFHTLPDEKKLRYLDFLATRLPGDGATKRDLPLILFSGPNCAPCDGFFDTLWKIKNKNFLTPVRFSYAVISTASTDYAQAVTAACIGTFYSYFQYRRNSRELHAAGIPTTDITRTISAYEMLRARTPSSRDIARGFSKKSREERVSVGDLLSLPAGFAECIDSGSGDAMVRDRASYATELEVLETPALVVGTTMVVGLPNAETLSRLIREELQKPVYSRPR